MTEGGGRLGVVAAVTMFVGAGWVLCVRYPSYAEKLIIGAAFFSLTQFYPVIQMVAGLCALAVADAVLRSWMTARIYFKRRMKLGASLSPSLSGSNCYCAPRSSA